MPPETASILYGLLSALAYGSGDFAGGLTSKKSSVYAVIILSQFAGLILYLLLALVGREALPPTIDLVYAVGGGAVGMIGLLCLYTALSRGNMGLTAPIAGIITAAIPVIVAIASEGLPETATLLGFAFGLPAVWLIARAPGADRIDLRALLLPIGAGLAFGVGFVLFARAAENSTFIPLAVARITSIVMLGLFVLLTRKPVTLASARVLPILVVVGILDAGGNGFFVLASQTGRLDIAAVLSSMYPAATVLLAWLILREKISRVQTVGVLLALIAIGLIAS